MLFHWYFLELLTITDISESSLLNHSSSFHYHDFISSWGKPNSMGRHHYSFSSKIILNSLLDDKLCNMNIYCTENVIEKKYVSVRIEGTSQGYSCLLSPRQGNPFFSDLSLNAFWKHLQVIVEAGIVKSLIKSRLMLFSHEGDVGFESVWNNAGFLSGVGNWAENSYLRVMTSKHFVGDGE